MIFSGGSNFYPPGMELDSATDLEVTSDVTGAIGFGAYSRGQWFNGAWSTVQARQSIAYQERFPVVIAAQLWGSFWARKHVVFRSDNKAEVAILMTRTSKGPALMHLLRYFLLSAACWVFTFTAAHVPEVKNKIADAISRFRWQKFTQLAPEAHSSPSPIPQLLLNSVTPPP